MLRITSHNTSVLQPETPNAPSPNPAGASSHSSSIAQPARPSDMQRDKHIKSLLKSFKKLELAVGKFESKPNGVSKTNILRTLVLPFLRSSQPLSATFSPSSKLYLSFVSISCTVLGRWWRSLLIALNATGAQSVSVTDRNAYLECVSRILARPEWKHAGAEAVANHKLCLIDTLDLSISKLLSYKVVPISICAFVGKVFAYSFYELPGVCNALLFLLNIKQKTLDVQLASMAPISPATKEKAKSLFPPHLTHMVDYRGIVNLEHIKRAAINSVYPPKHPVRGIRDPSGFWVRRWCSSDTDIFNSFFRHYINLANHYIDGCSDIPPEAFPGFSVVVSYFYQILTISMNRISATNVKSATAPQAMKTNASAGKPGAPKHTASDAISVSTSFPYKNTDSNYTSIIKLFKSVRDISFSAFSFSNQIVRILDQVLVNVASSINVYDMNKCSLILNLVSEYSIHIIDPSSMNWEFWLGCAHKMLSQTHHILLITKSFAFLFNVWDKIPSLLTRLENPSMVSFAKDWLKDVNDSYKTNFCKWLTSNEVWFDFFTHWNPLVRSHYIRLLIWRIIGINSYEHSCSMQATLRVKAKIGFMFASLCHMLSSPEQTEAIINLDFSAVSPIVNRKFGVVPFKNKSSFAEEVATLASTNGPSKPSDLRKTHPYEIFDEAIYTCTSLPSSPANSGTNIAKPQSSQIISSLGRVFKIFSNEDHERSKSSSVSPPPQAGDSSSKRIPTSKSVTSLTRMAMNSKNSSSAPSLATLQTPPPTPSMDASPESPSTSDSESSSMLSEYLGSSATSTNSSGSSSNAQPPELVKVLPEIVRPSFKFDIVLDHTVVANKYTRMQMANTNRFGKKFYDNRERVDLSYATMPKEPKVPLISVYLNADIYSRFQIARDEYNVDEEDLSEADIQELEEFCREYKKKLTSPEDYVPLGQVLNEWNHAVDEFETYLFDKIEAEQANFLQFTAAINDEDSAGLKELNEAEYLTKLIPLQPIDSFTELKLLNAS